MSVQNPLSEPESPSDEPAKAVVVPIIPRPAKRSSDVSTAVNSVHECQAISSAGPSEAATSTESTQSSMGSKLAASPSVSITEEDNEREETTVGEVSAGLLALSARPPPMAEIDFDEETRAFTAPEELLEMARRQRDARANGELDGQGNSLSPDPVSVTTISPGLDMDSYANVDKEGETSSSVPLVHVIKPALIHSAETSPPPCGIEKSPGELEDNSGHSHADTVNTVEAPPVPASSSMALDPATAQGAQHNEGNKESSPPTKVGWSSEALVLVVLVCVLLSFWLSKLL